MDLKINISKEMDNSTELLSEHRVIRVPKVYRNTLNLQIGEFLYLRNKSDDLEILQVSEAFKQDVINDPNCGYVSSNVYENLQIRNTHMNDVNRVENITLGCDPEAFLVDRPTRRLVHAYRLMNKNGDVGHDGILMEFRPNPSIHAEDVCNNIWGLIQKARGMLDFRSSPNQIAIVGGSSIVSGHPDTAVMAGFHLHYGLPTAMLGWQKEKKDVARIMVSAFDYYVGVPSIIPEGNTDIHRRTRQYVRYGKPGQHVLDNRTFEFRMPGGTNLRHPYLTIGLLSLGAVVAEDVVSRICDCTDSFTNLREMTYDSSIRELYPNIPDIHSFYGIICNPDISAARYHFETIKDDVRKMVGYKQREATVEKYFSYLDSNIQFGNDIEQNWGGFYNEKQQRQMVVL